MHVHMHARTLSFALIPPIPFLSSLLTSGKLPLTASDPLCQLKPTQIQPLLCVGTGGRNHGDYPPFCLLHLSLYLWYFPKVLTSRFAPLQGAGRGKSETQFEKLKEKLAPLGNRIHGVSAWCRFLFDR